MAHTMKLAQKLGPDAAKWFLRSIEGPECFWINNGPIVGNLEQLAVSIRGMKKEVFMIHVNKDKNDFGKWIEYVIGDLRLARDMYKSRSRRNILQALNRRIKTLEKVAGLEK